MFKSLSNLSKSATGSEQDGNIPSSAEMTHSTRAPVLGTMTFPSYTGGQPGNLPSFEWFDELETLATTQKRFSMQLSPLENQRQLEDPAKYIKRLELKPFRPQNEEEFENWLDELDVQCRAKRLCPEILMEAWIAVAPPATRKLITNCSWEALDFEDAVNKVVKKSLDIQLMRSNLRKAYYKKSNSQLLEEFLRDWSISVKDS